MMCKHFVTEQHDDDYSEAVTKAFRETIAMGTTGYRHGDYDTYRGYYISPDMEQHVEEQPDDIRKRFYAGFDLKEKHSDATWLAERFLTTCHKRKRKADKVQELWHLGAQGRQTKTTLGPKEQHDNI